MKLLPRRLVTLSLEGSRIRLLGTRGSEVEFWADIPFDERLLRHGQIGDPNAIGALIGETFHRRGLPRSRVVAAASGLGAVSRIITVAAPHTRLAEAVEIEARKVLPETLVDVTLYWQAIDPRTSHAPRVFLLATPRDTVMTLIDTLRIAGIQPLAIDLKPLALYRAVGGKDAVVAHLESQTLDIVIVVDDLPMLLRTVYLGEGAGSRDFLLGRLTDELSRTVRYYNDATRAAPLPTAAPIFLSGEDVIDPHLVATIEALTGHPVVAPQPPLDYPPDFPVERYLVNIGLALKSL
ncbi:MAG: pilus assembly protein PilM [Chloroflexota bacterium]|nr:pilus assembly protein PilM [Dehalococcoidia bacterium]MDW8254762.1 pilus assembly protein PilM [Chloroflexota bacterium]